MTTSLESQMETITIRCPKIDLNKLREIAKTMGWTIATTTGTSDRDIEWSEEQEREAFLATSRHNATRLFSKYLD